MTKGNETLKLYQLRIPHCGTGGLYRFKSSYSVESRSAPNLPELESHATPGRAARPNPLVTPRCGAAPSGGLASGPPTGHTAG